MSPGLPVVRLLAVIIAAIVALAAPFAAGAHEGHAPAGHHRVAAVAAEASPITLKPAAVGRVVGASGIVAVSAVDPSKGLIGADDRDEAERDGVKGICCCGAAGCAPGILATATELSGPASGRTRLRPYSAVARAGLEPEALTKPPRLFA